MKISRNKYDFISRLLETNKLDPAQKEKILKLTANELKKDFADKQEVEKRLRALETKLGHGAKDVTKNKVIHDPEVITKYLNQFKENTALKWTTHAWDNTKYQFISDFIESLNSNKKYIRLFDHNRKLYDLIRYFIYQPSDPKIDEKGNPKFGWKNLNDIKIGWQYPNNLLINWCKENYDNKNADERKNPFQFIIPKELKPKGTVKGREIKYFGDVVEIFKTEIQFREEYLYKELLKKKKEMADFDFEGLEDLRKLNFYTYTPGVLAAIHNIIEQIKRNETARKIRFSYEIINHQLILSITQINSFPTKDLDPNNPESFIGGQLNAIADSLFSLADFSIESRLEIRGGV